MCRDLLRAVRSIGTLFTISVAFIVQPLPFELRGDVCVNIRVDFIERGILLSSHALLNYTSS